MNCFQLTSDFITHVTLSSGIGNLLGAESPLRTCHEISSPHYCPALFIKTALMENESISATESLSDNKGQLLFVSM
jgi:hypothetical protein